MGTKTHQYVYDGENRLLSVDGSIAYTYDAEGNRVAKFLNGVEENEYLYDLSDRLVAEIGPDSKLVSGNIYAGGLFLAEDGQDGYENGNATMLRIADQVGTVRGRFDVFGNWVNGCTSLPFGDSETCGGPSAGDMFFTGKLRDTDTSLDDFGARDYSSVMGRFLTPDWSVDPEPVPYAKLDNPQSLNLYGYAANNPLSRIDIDGHCWDFLSGACDVLTKLGSRMHFSTWVAQQQNDNTEIAQNNTPPPPGGGRVNSPAQGQAPDSTVTIPDGKGGSTERTFGPDGRAVKDIDRGHDHGAGDPHAHDWDWGKKPPRQPGRPLTPEEGTNLKRTAKTVTAGVIIYWIVSEGSRILFPPRNPVPVP
jgi:RHS repeat-associated protein